MSQLTTMSHSDAYEQYKQEHIVADCNTQLSSCLKCYCNYKSLIYTSQSVFTSFLTSTRMHGPFPKIMRLRPLFSFQDINPFDLCLYHQWNSNHTLGILFLHRPIDLSAPTSL